VWQHLLTGGLGYLSGLLLGVSLYRGEISLPTLRPPATARTGAKSRPGRAGRIRFALADRLSQILALAVALGVMVLLAAVVAYIAGV